MKPGFVVNDVMIEIPGYANVRIAMDAFHVHEAWLIGAERFTLNGRTVV